MLELLFIAAYVIYITFMAYLAFLLTQAVRRQAIFLNEFEPYEYESDTSDEIVVSSDSDDSDIEDSSANVEKDSKMEELTLDKPDNLTDDSKNSKKSD